MTYAVDTLFRELLEAEKTERVAKQAKLDADMALSAASRAADNIRLRIAAQMREYGVEEDILEDDYHRYKLSFTKPRGAVKADADATPDEFCKIERKPRLKEIGEHLKSLEEQGQPLPNWATIEYGEPKLTWTTLKK